MRKYMESFEIRKCQRSREKKRNREIKLQRTSPALIIGLQPEKNEKSLKANIHGNSVGRFAFLKDFSISSVEKRLHDTGVHSGSYNTLVQIQARFVSLCESHGRRSREEGGSLRHLGNKIYGNHSQRRPRGMTRSLQSFQVCLQLERAKYIALWCLYYQDARWLKFKDAREEVT